MEHSPSFELYTLIHLEGRLTRLWRRNFLDPRRNKEIQVFYLPLAPLYRLDVGLHFKGADNLNDLLLSLSTGGELSAEDLGPLFEQQREGFYAPRLAGHVDDLTALDTSALRALVRAFRVLLERYPGQTRGLIDCDGLNWNQVMTLAGLSDAVVFDPPQDFFARQSAARALENLLEEIPPHLRLIRLKPNVTRQRQPVVS